MNPFLILAALLAGFIAGKIYGETETLAKMGDFITRRERKDK